MIQEALKKYGLTDKETNVYLALLELGKARVQEIAKRVRLPRSTVYSVLEALEQRGLLTTYDEGKIKIFIAENPKKIMHDMTERMKRLEDIYPDLKNLFQTHKTLPHIRYYEGKDALQDMYWEILNKKGLKEYSIIASEEEWQNLGSTFVKNFKKKRADAGIKTRMILEHSSVALARKAEEQTAFSEVKIIPPGFGWKFSAGCYIFKDRVIFIAYKKDLVACEIISAEITQLMTMMFEFMWRFLSR